MAPRSHKSRLKRPASASVVAASALVWWPALGPETSAQPVFMPVSLPPGLTGIGESSSPAWADLDGDGDFDLLVGEDFGRFFFFENTGTANSPAFAEPIENPFGLSDIGRDSAPAFADLDGDGDFDLLAGEREGNFYFFENTGTANSPAFAAPVSNPFGLLTINDYSTPTLADLDGDNDFDLLSGQKNGRFFYFENSGTAQAPAFENPAVNPFDLTSLGGDSAPAFADLDGDGDFDVLSGEYDGGFYLFQNRGTVNSPSFTGPSVNPFGLSAIEDYSAPSFVDLDGDGDLDLLAGDFYGSFTFFRNDDINLPVELVDFAAVRDGAAVLLRWQTASESDNAGFEIHRLLGSEAGAFEVLGFVAGHGTTQEARHYAFRTDALPVGPHRFRLKQVDFDGQAAFSETVEVAVEMATAYHLSRVYPNPFNPRAQMTLAVARAQQVRVAVYDLLGRKVAQLFDRVLEANQTVMLTLDGTAWSSGLYVVVVEGEDFRSQRTVTLLK